jgi:hypothetical protein
MVERVGVTEAPAIGERFPYIITKFGARDSLSDFIIDSDLVRKEGFNRYNVAKDHYYRLYIYNPMNVIIELVYGKKRSDALLDTKHYDQVETITAKKGNLLGFFGKDQVTNKRRFKGLGVDEQLLKEIRQMRITDTFVSREQIGADEDQPKD